MLLGEQGADPLALGLGHVTYLTAYLCNIAIIYKYN